MLADKHAYRALERLAHALDELQAAVNDLDALELLDALPPAT